MLKKWDLRNRSPELASLSPRDYRRVRTMLERISLRSPSPWVLMGAPLFFMPVMILLAQLMAGLDQRVAERNEIVNLARAEPDNPAYQPDYTISTENLQMLARNRQKITIGFGVSFLLILAVFTIAYSRYFEGKSLANVPLAIKTLRIQVPEPGTPEAEAYHEEKDLSPKAERMMKRAGWFWLAAIGAAIPVIFLQNLILSENPDASQQFYNLLLGAYIACVASGFFFGTAAQLSMRIGDVVEEELDAPGE